VSQAQISPDGTEVAFVAGEPMKMNGQTARARIWLVPTDGGPAREFSVGPSVDTAPRWSPDGESLAFLSDRDSDDDQLQVYLLSRRGGEGVCLTSLEGRVGVGRNADPLLWSPDGSSLGFLMRDPDTEAERQRRRERDDAVEFEENPKFTRLWVLDLATRQVRVVSPAGLQVWEFAWSPDGDYAALVVSDSPEEWSWYRARVARVRVADGEVQTLHASQRQVARPIYSPDQRAIAFISSVLSDRGVVGGDVLVVAAEGGEPRNLTRNLTASPAWLEWSEDSRSLLVLAHEDGGTCMFRIDHETGARRDLWSGRFGVAEWSWPRFSRAKDGSIAVVREDARSPANVWLARPTEAEVAWTRLTSLNAHAADFLVGEVDSVRWAAPDGREIQGFVVQPVGYEAGRSYPLVTWVHGGPTATYAARYLATQWAAMLAGRGIAAFLPNPRGSVGQGREFAEANVGDMGGKDLGDILAGIDHLVATGLADPERLGIGGWSYGGFLTCWAITQTDRFKAAVMGAGICDWLSFHGTSHLGGWDAAHYAADPYERGGPLERFSAIHQVKRVRTPTLIVHGEVDRDVPVSQSYEFHRALKDHGVPTRLVVYPREGHGIAEKAHVVDLGRRIQEWFVTYLT
jgi:dipeptidyl aminopeptidase/acylaminoacyl peptidase